MIGVQPTPGIREADLPDPGRFDAFHPFIKGVFSQWHHTPFSLEGHVFACAEQWMMYCKARLFADEDCTRKIMATDDPAIQKRLGQHVRGFDQLIWDRWKIEIVYRGNHAKFAQNEGALRQLRGTAPKMLVEANPRDWVWGSGCAIDDSTGHTPANWKGTNLLGRILTRVRQDLD